MYLGIMKKYTWTLMNLQHSLVQWDYHVIAIKGKMLSSKRTYTFGEEAVQFGKHLRLSGVIFSISFYRGHVSGETPRVGRATTSWGIREPQSFYNSRRHPKII